MNSLRAALLLVCTFTYTVRSDQGVGAGGCNTANSLSATNGLITGAGKNEDNIPTLQGLGPGGKCTLL